MIGRRLMRLGVLVLLVAVVSLGSTMTAATIVPASNAGITNVPMEMACSFNAALTFDRTNMNRAAASHLLLITTISFPYGLPEEASWQPISNVVMRLPGGTQEITPWLQVGSTAVFTRESILWLVGPANGDFVLEVGGMVGPCEFTAQDTLKITGPIH